MNQPQQQPPSKILMLAPVALVLIAYGFFYLSPQQSRLRSAQQRFDKLAKSHHENEHQVVETKIESARLRNELSDVDAKLGAANATHARLEASRKRMRRQLDVRSNPAAVMQRVTTVMANHRLLLLESVPEPGAARRAKEIVMPVARLLADDGATPASTPSRSADSREIYELRVRGRFRDLQAALDAIATDLENVIPLSLQMEPLELESPEARQPQRVWVITILV